MGACVGYDHRTFLTPSKDHTFFTRCPYQSFKAYLVLVKIWPNLTSFPVSSSDKQGLISCYVTDQFYFLICSRIVVCKWSMRKKREITTCYKNNFEVNISFWKITYVIGFGLSGLVTKSKHKIKVLSIVFCFFLFFIHLLYQEHTTCTQRKGFHFP